jgi:dual specificity protein kinase YAK1
LWAAELFLGLPLFPAISQVHLLVLMEEMLGPFPREVSVGSRYFAEDGGLKGLEQLQAETGEDFSEFEPYFVEKGLERIVLAMLEVGEREVSEEHARVFLDLLKKLLEFDPMQRISPAQALAHPFFALQT